MNMIAIDHLSDGGEDEWLSLVVAVGADAEVHLLGVGVLLEGLGHAQDGVGGTHLHAGPPGAGRKKPQD